MTDPAYLYHTCRVKSRDTGKPTTISLDHTTFIRLCQLTRDVRAASALVRRTVAELDYDPNVKLSEQVEKALLAHLMKAGA